MMHSWNRWAWSLVASMALSTQAFAYGLDGDCCDSCYDGCLGNVGFGIEFLVWDPCIDDLDYAVITNAPLIGPGVATTGHNRFIEHDYAPAVRLSLSLPDVWCGWNMSSSYTYFNDSENNRITGAAGTIHSTAFHPGLLDATTGFIGAEASHRIRYQTWDLLFSYDCNLCDCHNFSPFVGLEYVNIDHELSHGLRTTDGAQVTGDNLANMSWDGEYWGIGFKAGAEYRTPICDCYEFYTMASASLTKGELSDVSRYNVNSNGTITDIRFKRDECGFVPGWHVGLGVSYSNHWCGQVVTAHAGYEFLQWLNTPALRRFDDAGPANGSVANASSIKTGSIAFHGFNFGLSLAF